MDMSMDRRNFIGQSLFGCLGSRLLPDKTLADMEPNLEYLHVRFGLVDCGIGTGQFKRWTVQLWLWFTEGHTAEGWSLGRHMAPTSKLKALLESAGLPTKRDGPDECWLIGETDLVPSRILARVEEVLAGHPQEELWEEPDY